jgi:DNA (cytosine-5)-methyltransferase 1
VNELALFAGGGGGILGGHLLGWRTVCAVEFASFQREVLLARQRDGILPRFPIWDDVRTFDGTPWRGWVDVISGGFPCQDISSAGGGAGITGERSGLWKEMVRIVCEVQPRFVFVENSPMLTSRGLGVVLGDLAAMGFDARWGVLGAYDVGADHARNRIWIVANARQVGRTGAIRAQNDGEKREGGTPQEWCPYRQSTDMVSRRVALRRGWPDKPDPPGVADGMASWLDRLATIGNGQVPAVAAAAWQLLSLDSMPKPPPVPVTAQLFAAET